MWENFNKQNTPLVGYFEWRKEKREDLNKQ